MEFNTIIHSIKLLSVLLVQIESKLLPLRSFNFLLAILNEGTILPTPVNHKLLNLRKGLLY